MAVLFQKRKWEKSRGFDHAKLKCVAKQKWNFPSYLQNPKLEQNLNWTDFQAFSQKDYKMSLASDVSMAMDNKFDSLGLAI